MTKDLRYPWKQRHFPQRALVSWLCRAESDFGLGLGLRSPTRIGLELGLVLRTPVALTGLVVGLGLRSPSLIGLGLGLGLRSPTRIGLWFGLGLRSPTWNRTLDFGPENRTLVSKVRGRRIGLLFWTWTSCASLLSRMPWNLIGFKKRRKIK